MRSLTLAPLALLFALPAFAQPAQNSEPPAPAPEEPIPAPQDTAYPGTINLEVDASDTRQGIFHTRETIPVEHAGRMVLYFPAWLPGEHSPTGPIESIAGLRFTAGGHPLAWRRNPTNVYAFDVDVPQGARTIDVALDYLSLTSAARSRVDMTPDLLSLEWQKMSLYPAGHYTRRIPVRASVTLPAGFTAVSAIDGTPRQGHVVYPVTDYETLVDSPLYAGRNFREWHLGHDVDLNVFADRPEDLAATPEQIEAHRRLVEQAVRLFGARHFDHYDFLFSLSNELSGNGLEHHRSSEDGEQRDYFTDWAHNAAVRTLLPHEFTHSWNGKYRRPFDLWTPDFQVPMQDSGLWVYEGQTQYWQTVLGTRSGIEPRDVALGEIADNAAYYQAQAGRSWRPLLDTTNQPIIAERRPQAFTSWQRTEDYYREGSLIWLDADMLIRELTHGQRSLDDFAHAFFGVRDGDWGTLTYTREDVIRTLNQVAPYDWARFLHERVDLPGAPPPLDGIRRAGYRLVFRPEPNPFDQSRMHIGHALDLSYSLGLTIGRGGAIGNVIWDGPAFQAGMPPGATIVAVNDHQYDDDDLKSAITAASHSQEPIRLLVKINDRYRDIVINYHGGLRWPWLERIPNAPDLLDRLFTPLG